MTPSFGEILEVLKRHQVEFIVVGGVAAVVRGAPVTTFDLDALIRVNEDNAERLIHALSELDARYREHATTLNPTKANILAGGHILLLTRAGPLDILGFIGNQQRYDDLLSASSNVRLGAISVRVLDLKELIRQKRASDRPKDRAVLGLLEEVLRRQKNPG